MITDSITAANLNVRGQVKVWRVAEKNTLLVDQKNQIQYSWGFIAANQIGFRPQPGRLNYNISALYIEFENMADPADAATVAAFDRELSR